MKKFAVIALILAMPLVFAQQKGTQTAEYHPPITLEHCESKGVCRAEEGGIVVDSNWRWTHKAPSGSNCYTGNLWNQQYCATVEECTENCALDGIDKSEDSSTYHVLTEGSQLELGFVTQGPYSKNIGSRTYVTEDDDHYKMFYLMNQEFTFDVDVSQLPCGLNGAAYFVEMDQDGGMSKYSTNHVGARYGTGYCDAQCPHDMKWINGEANSGGWVPDDNDPNSGKGHYGTCCSEMDIWEANSQSVQITPHSCSTKGQYRCEGTECGDIATGERYDGVCDKDGCDFNPYRLGVTDFYGEGSGFSVDTTKKMTVVTQWLTDDGTANGTLSEIRRYYVQDGKVIGQPMANTEGLAEYDSITQTNCDAQKKLFNETNSFAQHGGMANMGESLGRGMVFVMSLWDDHYADMLWLDSDYPTDLPSDAPGVHRGPCSTSSGVPSDVEENYPKSKVVFSNIKYGPINSTFGEGNYACNSGKCTLDASGSYNSLTDCETACSEAPDTKYSCDSGTGSCKVDSAGTYTSLSDCESYCSSIPRTLYSCNQGQCSENQWGTYDSLSDCQANCVEMFRCDTGQYHCIADPHGEYDQAGCNTNCHA